MSFRILGTARLDVRHALVLGALSSTLLGCGAEGLDDQAFDDSGVDEPIGQTEEAIGATFDIGGRNVPRGDSLEPHLPRW
jgi:hypothetical protein